MLINTTPLRYDARPELAAGRPDIQGNAHFFFDTLFCGCTVLDVGAGLGRSKARIRHNHVTTYDIDERLRGVVDHVGPEMPEGPFDVVAAFDVLEHVEDPRGFLHALYMRATRAVFFTTPNAAVRERCGEYHHFEYTAAEVFAFFHQTWADRALFDVFAFYKDVEGGWWESPRIEDWKTHRGLAHGMLAMFGDHACDDAGRIINMHENGMRWLARLNADDIPGGIKVVP